MSNRAGVTSGLAGVSVTAVTIDSLTTATVSAATCTGGPGLDFTYKRHTNFVRDVAAALHSSVMAVTRFSGLVQSVPGRVYICEG